MFKRILVPLDESALAECVLPHVVALARAFQAQVTLLHVLGRHYASDPLLPADPFDWHLRWAEMETYLERVGNKLNEVEVATESALLEGRVAEGREGREEGKLLSYGTELRFLLSFDSTAAGNGGYRKGRSDL